MDITDIIIKEKSGAKVILMENEMDIRLNSIETVTGYGLRDKAIFELICGTGTRIGEMVHLNVGDVDFSLNEILKGLKKTHKMYHAMENIKETIRNGNTSHPAVR